METEYQFVYVTTENEEQAMTIARAVVGERLAACGNILPGMRSVYWWDGALLEAAEAVLILKTRRDLFDTLAERIRELHSYDCPCIVALPIAAGSAAYLEWISAETSIHP